MHARVPVVAVVGHKNSGKTTVIESIVKELTKRKYRVATAKHILEKGFSMDVEGKDTWRHSAVGANPVVSVSDVETCILIKNGAKKFSLNKLFSFAPEADVMVLEGFSWLILDDEHVGKILCVRNRREYTDFMERAKEEVIASCSTRLIGSPVLRIREDSSILVRRALSFIERRSQRSSAVSQG